MLEILTQEQYYEIEEESLKPLEIVDNSSAFDCVDKWESQLKLAFYRQVQLRPELSLEIFDKTYYRQVNCLNTHNGQYTLTAKFYLAGNHSVICPGISGVKENYQEIAGNNYLFYLPDIEEIEQYFPGDRYYLIRIIFDLNFFRNFATGFSPVPKQLQPLLECDHAPCFHLSVGKITPTMQTVLSQLLNAPYQGMVQRIYLESKVLELLALQLAQILETEKNSKKVINLKAADIERIHHAREILISQYDNPPTLLDLAKKVGVNDHKLKLGFREVFGTTVFGYLHNYRMEMAKMLLQEGEQNVAEVASYVGYSNPGHFAAAFKRKFGMSPKICRLGRN
ncbi:helix-turn-helix domain-containing protein [Sphaerospermopsis sp. LEGE 08334]|jgi:AraC family transcriptional activator of pyochelin receptor|uniref:helix-turn-helix transcriptional regulator n=1 Tax=Sphaerospermopsis sp. LEGE 08334 TaxID=1828651 RepID=UPI0018821B37|nr:helix-turn-helix domain-containing protein [Sphaerospermopsis sp. LEGE 08334]MBE9058231.1 helix-turn-helix transcriptional regulator [Sphaerospermopsis sp. LEGE 08334]